MPNDAAGEILGRYKLIREMNGTAKTAHSLVYVSSHISIKQKRAATKILPPSISPLDSSRKKLFDRETEAVAEVRHKRIVPVDDMGRVDNPDSILHNHFYIHMALMETSLGKIVEAQGVLDEDAAIKVAEQTLEALVYLHNPGNHSQNKAILHLDIHEGNILFDKGGDAYLSDFGYAKWLEEAGLTTKSGTVSVAKYSAPEQNKKGRAIDERTDIFQLGATLQYALTGEVLQAFLVQAYDGISAELVDIVQKSLEWKPGERYQSAQEMLDSIRDLRERRALYLAGIERYLDPFRALLEHEGIMPVERIEGLYGLLESAEQEFGANDITREMHGLLEERKGRDYLTIEEYAKGIKGLNPKHARAKEAQARLIEFIEIAHAYEHHGPDCPVYQSTVGVG